MGEYKFDLNNMDEDLRNEAANAAQQTTHMEENAGKIMAELLLPVKDHLQAALKAANSLQHSEGFGDLPTGDHVAAFYDQQRAAVQSKLRDDLKAVQDDIDRFLAMQLLYENRDQANAKTTIDVTY